MGALRHLRQVSPRPLLLAPIVAPPGPVAAALARRAGADPANADLASAGAYLRDVAARLSETGWARTRVATGATPAEGLASYAPPTFEGDAAKPPPGVGDPSPGNPFRPVASWRAATGRRPYIRESRRIRAAFSVAEQYVRAKTPRDREPSDFADAIGVSRWRSMYRHPNAGGDNYIEIQTPDILPPLQARSSVLE